MATANGSSVGATPAQRDLQSIPFRGHTIHVWRQPEPTKHAFAWRVVRDDLHSVATDEADTCAEAWNAAIAQVPGASQAQEPPAFDFDRWNRCRWDRLPDYSLTASGSLESATPGLVRRLEGIKHSARGLQSILRVLMVADMHAEWFTDGEEEARPLSPFVAEGLHLAADQLAQRVEDEIHGITAMEVSDA